MSYFLRKTSLCIGCYSVRSLLLGQRLTTPKDVIFTRIRWFSISSEECQNHSFTVIYLMKSLGFSVQKALSTSKRVSFETTEKPDKAIEFFMEYGLTRSQIGVIVGKYPRVLMSDTDKVILPKLEFLRSKGLSKPEAASILSLHPDLIKTSLDEKIVPSYNLLRDAFGSDEKAIAVVSKAPSFLCQSLEENFSPNIRVLRQYRVPGQNIFILGSKWPRLLSRPPIDFRKAVDEAVDLGFVVSTMKFAQATAALLVGMGTESSWEMKAKAYKKWGWSNELLLTAFRADPRCMLYSLDKISATMEFFVIAMGLIPAQLAKMPDLLNYDVDRIKRKCLIYHALVKNRLVKDNLSVVELTRYPEKDFMLRFVKHYYKQVPGLLDLYKGDSDFSWKTRKWR